jgi:predicted DNA-binding transcriptional regulator AlpA
VTNGYLGVEQVAERFGISTRSVHEYVKRRAIPHRRLPAMRRIVFIEDELRAWIDGAALEVVHPPQGGRIVRPQSE